MDDNDPFGYMQYRRPVRHEGQEAAAVEHALTPQASPHGDDAGTPKAPRLPVEGRATRICPGAPRKGKAPSSYFDHLSGEAPVRRLSFGAASSDMQDESDSMDDDMRDEEPEQQQQQQPEHLLPQRQLRLSQLLPQPWLQDQPRPPPASQLPPMPQQPPQHQPRQLFTQSPMQQRSPLLRSPQLQFMSLQQPLQQPQQSAQQLWQPLSPTGARPGNQPNLTPARLFR